MSQIGGEAAYINISAFPSEPSEIPFADDSSLLRAILLLSTSVTGLLGNLITLLMVLVVKKLQKPQNAFFVHHCILDSIKSAYCIVFSKSLFEQQSPKECAILGASYIVFVTTSAFNILAVTINEIYHFTNKVIGVQINNRCCVLFGLFIIWFASIIVNLGVAFLPGNPTFDRAIGSCTFMYGVTGNYLLHVLWIIVMTFALILTGIYLRKLWVDLKGRAFFRVTTLFHQTINLSINENGTSDKLNRYKRNVDTTVQRARRNFFLLASMVIVFTVFWYPLFILTLADPYFNAQPKYYRSLTLFAWCHSALTPLFFIIYNINSIRELKTNFLRRAPLLKNEETPAESSTSNPVERSPVRPNSLNVRPYYSCDNHTASGKPCYLNQNSSSSASEEERRTRAQSLATAKLIHQSESPRDFYEKRRRAQSLFVNITDELREKVGEMPHMQTIRQNESVSRLVKSDIQGKKSSAVKERCKLDRDKYRKMGLVNERHYKDRENNVQKFQKNTKTKAALTNEVIHQLLDKNLSPTFVQHIINLQDRAANRKRRSMPALSTEESDMNSLDCSHLKRSKSVHHHRSVTFPDSLTNGLNSQKRKYEVEVDDDTEPSPCLSVHRVNADQVVSPNIVRSMSAFHIRGDHSIDWV